MTADYREDLRSRRDDFAAGVDEARAYVHVCEAAFLDSLVQGRITAEEHTTLAAARAQMATAEANLAMLDRVLADDDDRLARYTRELDALAADLCDNSAANEDGAA